MICTPTAECRRCCASSAAWWIRTEPRRRITVARRDLGGARPTTGALRLSTDPVDTCGSIAILHGTLAPDGAVIKRSAATRG